MVSRRLALHQSLGLPTDRPALRLANAAVLEPDSGEPASTSGRLRDVHEGIAASGIPSGKAHTIWGTYDYHHYMQACLSTLALKSMRYDTSPDAGSVSVWADMKWRWQ